MSKKVIQVKNIQVNLITRSSDDYISLTDMAKWKSKKSPDQIIANWMRTSYTIEFLGLWEL